LIALYCSGYEAVVCNVFAVGLGPVMLDIGFPYLYIWFALVAINSTLTHSGIKMSWLADGSHDEHHRNNVNFGVLGIFDKIYGTYFSVLDIEINKTVEEKNKTENIVEKHEITVGLDQYSE